MLNTIIWSWILTLLMTIELILTTWHTAVSNWHAKGYGYVFCVFHFLLFSENCLQTLILNLLVQSYDCQVFIPKLLIFNKKVPICSGGLLWWQSDEEPTCQFRDVGLIPESERSPGEGNGNLLQYSCLRNTMDRWAWWTTVCGVPEELDMA